MKSTRFDSGGHYKEAIKAAVRKYKNLFPEEYVEVCHAIRTRQEALYDSRFAKAEGVSKDSDLRALYEIPETLNNMIINALDLEGLTWFSGKEPSRWFAKTFPEFRLPEQI